MEVGRGGEWRVLPHSHPGKIDNGDVMVMSCDPC